MENKPEEQSNSQEEQRRFISKNDALLQMSVEELELLRSIDKKFDILIDIFSNMLQVISGEKNGSN